MLHLSGSGRYYPDLEFDQTMVWDSLLQNILTEFDFKSLGMGCAMFQINVWGPKQINPGSP